MAFSPDGKLLALSGAGTHVQLLDPSTGAAAHAPLSLAGFSAGTYAGTVVFSPDGSMLAAGSGSGVYVWQVPSFTSPTVFQAIPTGADFLVTPALEVRPAFTLNSRYLTMFAATTFGNTLEAWDIPDHLQVFHASLVSAGSLDPAGTKLVTTSIDDGVSVYPCQLCGSLPQLLALARQRVTRSLTGAERAEYLSEG